MKNYIWTYQKLYKVNYIRLKLSKFNEIITFGPPKNPVYMRLPYIGSYSQSYSNKISTVMQCFNSVVVWNIFATRSAFPSVLKFDLLTSQQRSLIYRFKCWGEANYMYKTIQRLEVRIAQHVPLFTRRYAPLESGNSQANDSTIREHSLFYHLRVQ